MAVAAARVTACAPGRLVARTGYDTDIVVRARRAGTVVVLLSILGAAVALWPVDTGVASVGDYEVTAGTAAVSGLDSAVDAGAAGPLTEGSSIRTGAPGGAALSLDRATVVRLGPSTDVEVGGGTDDDPASTPTRSIKLGAGRLWMRQAQRSLPLVVGVAGVTFRATEAAADIDCGPAGCAARVISGEVVATVGWDRFRVHAGESVTFGPSGEAGTLKVLDPVTLTADEWVVANLESDEAGSLGAPGSGTSAQPALADAQIEGTWAVSTTVVESATIVRPLGPEAGRTWGVSQDCADGECRAGVVDTAGASTVVGTGRRSASVEHVDGLTRTFDCVATGSGDVTATDALAETRSTDVRAVAAVRSGGRWLATEIAGSGDGDLHWAGRGRTCRGVRPGSFRFDLRGVRLDLAS